ncbi:peptide transporter, partial [Francisella tularensis subsp. holarctica]|nr:peptide transporter [Francisella tularensis subsp. holarctica]
EVDFRNMGYTRTILIVSVFIIVIIGLSVILQTIDSINYILWFGAGLIFGVFSFQIYFDKDNSSRKMIVAAIILLGSV